MNTGDRIKEQRKKIGMTADELGKKIGKGRATIYKYENGDIENMPVDALKPIADALGCTPAYLMGWDDEFGTVTEKVKTDRQFERLKSYAEKLSPEGMQQLEEFAQFLLSKQNPIEA